MEYPGQRWERKPVLVVTGSHAAQPDFFQIHADEPGTAQNRRVRAPVAARARGLRDVTNNGANMLLSEDAPLRGVPACPERQGVRTWENPLWETGRASAAEAAAIATRRAGSPRGAVVDHSTGSHFDVSSTSAVGPTDPPRLGGSSATEPTDVEFEREVVEAENAMASLRLRLAEESSKASVAASLAESICEVMRSRDKELHEISTALRRSERSATRARREAAEGELERAKLRTRVSELSAEVAERDSRIAELSDRVSHLTRRSAGRGRANGLFVFLALAAATAAAAVSLAGQSPVSPAVSFLMSTVVPLWPRSVSDVSVWQSVRPWVAAHLRSEGVDNSPSAPTGAEAAAKAAAAAAERPTAALWQEARLRAAAPSPSPLPHPPRPTRQAWDALVSEGWLSPEATEATPAHRVPPPSLATPSGASAVETGRVREFSLRWEPPVELCSLPVEGGCSDPALFPATGSGTDAWGPFELSGGCEMAGPTDSEAEAGAGVALGQGKLQCQFVRWYARTGEAVRFDFRRADEPGSSAVLQRCGASARSSLGAAAGARGSRGGASENGGDESSFGDRLAWGALQGSWSTGRPGSGNTEGPPCGAGEALWCLGEGAQVGWDAELPTATIASSSRP